MKIIFTTILLFCLLFTAAAQDKSDSPEKPKIAFGLKTGVNSSIFSSSVNSESSFRTGFHLGAYVKTPITYRFFFRPEIYFSSQGQKDDYGSGSKTTTTVNYVNIPLLFEQGRKVSFQFGPQIGLLVAGHEKGTIDGEPVDDDLKDFMRGLDLSIVAGVGVAPSDNLNFGLRLNYGLTDILKADEDAGVTGYPDFQNRVFHFYVGYSF